MNHRTFAAALLLSAPIAGAWMLGCGDDEVFSDNDAGSFEAGPVPDSGTPNPQTDAGDAAAPSTCGDSTGSPQRLLLTMNNMTTSELAAFNIADKKVDGRFSFASYIGRSSSFDSDPYVVEQASDLVARMSAQSPWEQVSTWNVAGDDAVDGGSPNAQPIAMVVPTCTKGYVLRYNRNKIAVVDTTKTADGGAPESYVDLSSLVQPDDNDGLVDMASALYVPAKNRIYVVLGNYDRTTVQPPNYAVICKNTKASVIAIDATTGALVSLGGTAPGGGIALAGANPSSGTPLVYDATRNRLLVFNYGCNVDAGGGAPGALEGRTVDAVDLATGAATAVLTLNDKPAPGNLVLMDANRAAVTFTYPNEAYFWDPSQSTLGPAVPGGFDQATHDGKGNLVGARSTFVDGGTMVEVLSAPFTAGDGGTIDASAVQTLGENPFTDNSGFLGGAEVWPRP